MVELFRALGALAEPPGADLAPLGELLELGGLPDAVDHADLFLFQLPPFASIYLGPEGKLGGETLDRIAGFWRAVGGSPPAEPDHLGALLGLYAGLLEASEREDEGARRALGHRAAGALLHEHLLPWTGPYLGRIQDVGTPFYRRWAALLSRALSEAAATHEAPEAPAAHLRDAPSLPDPRTDGGAAFLDGLLSPVRSGMILLRSDVATAAAETALGLRAGERRYALEAMFAQDAAAVLDWLSGEAAAQAGRHEALTDTVGPAIASYWHTRAQETRRLLDELSSATWEVTPCPA